MVDFPIVDSHIHLLEPARFGYAWTKGAPSLNRRVLPSDLTRAAAPFVVDRFVFVEVDVDFPQHLAEADWVADDDEHLNPMGVKGLGEIGICGSVAAIANAVYHATGVRHRDLPISPVRILMSARR